ncbi:DUF4326 domain-containing protein [Sinorhizobium medicae]|uniref:DUF4326 domain-containing protein n=1 Tax=Sinorhizobium medicae TaxID=110321 RepID=UPI0003813773|nr:DUF4326 domain-containing protein [Sinorhizobium medicae]MDX0831238.1 DUF4326 domain-containing protein [Sinorhizobium medicae]RVI57154.1 DUF4326 domain-containing protein [Sinorhizobium medicae]UFX00312.1 DUF4326 domain-containing protein [Sinorhizobium medicae WSM1115]
MKSDNRIQQLDQGLAVVGTMRMIGGRLVDHDLITYAEDRNLVVHVDRSTAWGNPFTMTREAERNRVCDQYESAIRANPELMTRVPSLKGKLLLCWCHPRRCHGDTLAMMANGVEA